MGDKVSSLLILSVGQCTRCDSHRANDEGGKGSKLHLCCSG